MGVLLTPFKLAFLLLCLAGICISAIFTRAFVAVFPDGKMTEAQKCCAGAAFMWSIGLAILVYVTSAT